MAYGDLYKIEVDGVVGCAAIEYVQKRRLLAKELLIPHAQMGKAVETIAKEMEASRYHIRTPGFLGRPVRQLHPGLRHDQMVRPRPARQVLQHPRRLPGPGLRLMESFSLKLS